MITLPYSNGLDTISFANMLDANMLTNSYKLFWLKAIVTNIENSKLSVSYSELIFSMLEESYDLVLLFHLRFGGGDIIPNILFSMNPCSKNEFLSIFSHKDFQQIVNKLTNYVPYRLLTPFYEDFLLQKVDGLKNRIIEDLSHSDPLALYKINSAQQSIEINPIWASYIKDNMSIIKAWIDLKLINFLQRRNPSVPNIPFKVSPLKNRNLNRAKKLWDKAIDINPALNYDLFLDIKFNTHTIQEFGTLSIDHFLPWSFVAHDELWNLIPIHKNINSMKNNNLPSSRFIKPYIELQYDFFSTIRLFSKPKDLEEYRMLINNSSFNYNNLEYEHFYNTFYENTLSLYNIAKNNGFSIWNDSNL